MKIINAYAVPGIRQEDKVMWDKLLVQKIIEKVCKYFDVDELDVRSHSRRRELVIARQWCMFFIKQKTKYTLREIGNEFSGRDHTTVIYAIESLNGWITAKYDNLNKDDYHNLLLII